MKTKIGIIGGGNMGSAILGGIHRRYDVTVCEKDKKRSQELKRQYKVDACELKSLVLKSDVIILAVKPQSFDAILKEVGHYGTSEKLYISIAAGITTQYIEKKLGSGSRVIRCMPNLPAQISEGITGVCKGRLAKEEDVQSACEILSYIGETVEVEEKLMDSITAVSGSGPAYVFQFIESFTLAAKSVGLDDEMANKFVLETLKGSLNLIRSSKEDAATLKSRVTSEGGTTAAALEVFKKHNIDRIFKDALSAARKRAKELSL